MGFFQFMGRTFLKPCVDVKSWINWPGLRDGATSIVRLFKGAFYLPKKTKQARRTFDEVAEQLSITDADLNRKLIFLRYHFFIYLGMLVLSVLYLFYLLTERHWFSSGITTVFALFFAVKIWETYFLKFQIQHRNLCTVKEWWQDVFKRKSR